MSHELLVVFVTRGLFARQLCSLLIIIRSLSVLAHLPSLVCTACGSLLALRHSSHVACLLVARRSCSPLVNCNSSFVRHLLLVCPSPVDSARLCVARGPMLVLAVIRLSWLVCLSLIATASYLSLVAGCSFPAVCPSLHVYRSSCSLPLALCFLASYPWFGACRSCSLLVMLVLRPSFLVVTS